MMVSHKCFTGFCSLVLVVIAGREVNADFINMVLAENGGVLESGSEVLRDGDYGTHYGISGKSGTLVSKITFPESDIAFIDFRMSGACYQHDGGATCVMDVSLRVDDAWTPTLYHWQGSGWAAHDTSKMTLDNGGSGWENCSGMELWGSIWGSDTGTASVDHWEMAAWAEAPVPEPTTLVGLITLGATGLIGVAWQRRKRPASQA